MCSLRFGSWTYDIKRLDPQFLDGREAMKVDGYVPSSEWEIIQNAAQKNVLLYPCCDNPYADLTFNLTLKRRVTFHIRLILIPTVLLSAMSVAIFCIPPNRPDRTGLGTYCGRGGLLLSLHDRTGMGKYYGKGVLLFTLSYWNVGGGVFYRIEMCNTLIYYKYSLNGNDTL